MSERESQEEKTLLRQIYEGEERVNEIFRELEIRASSITQTPNASAASRENPEQAYLNKYNKYSMENVKQNYENAITGLKWYELPFCRAVVMKKIKFWIPASSILALVFTMQRMSKHNIQQFPYRFFAKSYAGFIVGTCIFALAESILFEPYWYSLHLSVTSILTTTTRNLQDWRLPESSKVNHGQCRGIR